MLQTFENIGSLGECARIQILQLMYVVLVTIRKFYFKALLRITSLLSRQQEYRADELACAMVGPESLTNALRAVRCE
jgi:Zn-dependent protease with chaperone function